jgi:aminoglycoside 6'-N-acetyltransferase I
MRIITLAPEDEATKQQLAALLVEAFREHWPEAWPTLADAREEVQASLAEDRISRVALDDNDQVLGWIGGIAMYDGRVWELHPLAVSPRLQRRGIGRALVEDLEIQVAARGGLTLWLGTDDENGMTSLADVDLYPHPLTHLAQISNLRNHPYEFYQKLGFVLAGVLPDANGWGKPDILMAKRVRRSNEEKE